MLEGLARSNTTSLPTSPALMQTASHCPIIPPLVAGRSKDRAIAVMASASDEPGKNY